MKIVETSLFVVPLVADDVKNRGTSYLISKNSVFCRGNVSSGNRLGFGLVPPASGLETATLARHAI